MDIRRAAIAAAGGAAVAALTLGALPVGAQETDLLPISVSPTSGPAGTVVIVSGTDCAGGAVEAGLIDPESGTGVIDASTHGDEFGDWSVELQVPSDAQAGAVLVIVSECIMEGGPSYEFVEFELTGTAATPPAPAAPPAVEPAAAPVAAPAAAVPSQPSYAG